MKLLISDCTDLGSEYCIEQSDLSLHHLLWFVSQGIELVYLSRYQCLEQPMHLVILSFIINVSI